MMAKRFFINAEDRWEDGFTYGEWRQFIVRHADGSTQPARPSRIPLWLFTAGLLLWLVSVNAAILCLVFDVQLHFVRVYVAFATGILMMIPMVTETITGRRLMTAVGPVNRVEGDRTFRVFDWELDE